MTPRRNLIPILLLGHCLGLTFILGQAADGNDLLDEVARRLMSESDYVYGSSQNGRTSNNGGNTDGKTDVNYVSPSCGSNDVLHGKCSKDGMVCPMVGRHTSYLKCVHQHWLSMPCAPGTMFDLNSKTCASPHDIQPPPVVQPVHPPTFAQQPGQPPQAGHGENKNEGRPEIQNDSPSLQNGPRVVGFMDFPPPGYPPYLAPGMAGHYPPAVYPPGVVPVSQKAANGQAGAVGNQQLPVATPAPKQQQQQPANVQDGHVTNDKTKVCKIGTYRSVPGNKKYYEHCIGSGSNLSQWMRRLCPPGMVADENPIELPCRFSVKFGGPVKNTYQQQDTKPKNQITSPYNYKYVRPSKQNVAVAPLKPHTQQQYVPVPQVPRPPPTYNKPAQPKYNQAPPSYKQPAPSYKQPSPSYNQQPPPVYNKPAYIYYYQESSKKQEPPVNHNQWNRPDQRPDIKDPFRNGERVVHNVDHDHYDNHKEEQSRYNVDWSQAGRQGNINQKEDMDQEQEPVQPRPAVRVVTQYVTMRTEPTTLPTTLPTTQATEATTPVTIQQPEVTVKETDPPATAPPVVARPEPKQAAPEKPTELYPNYLENPNFMKLLKDLAAKYIENASKQNSTLNDKPTEESVTVPNVDVEPEEPEEPSDAENVETPKDNDVIINFDNGRYELPFIVDMDDLVLWPRDVAAGGEKTDEEKENPVNPFYLLKLPNTAATSNQAAALAAGLKNAISES